MSSAYKQGGIGRHHYYGDRLGKASRQDSKIHKAMKNVASFDILDEVYRDDLRRQRKRAKWHKPNNNDNDSMA